MRLSKLPALAAVALAVLAVLAAATPASVSAAQDKYAAKNTFKTCFLNKAWVVWEADIRIHTMEYVRSLAGPMVLMRKTTGDRFKLALNQSKCFEGVSAADYSVQFAYSYGNGQSDYASGPLNGDTTFRLDGTMFNAWVSKWPGAHES